MKPPCLAPLEKGGIGIKVPLFKGDLGGSSRIGAIDRKQNMRGYEYCGIVGSVFGK
jgi:hypothetical protein